MIVLFLVICLAVVLDLQDRLQAEDLGDHLTSTASQQPKERKRPENCTVAAIGPVQLALSRAWQHAQGAGIYRLIGQAAGQVGNAVWLAFVVALVAALLTALSYASLGSRYPRAAGAAYVTERAFGLPLLSFVVGLALVCSGLTSSSQPRRACPPRTLRRTLQSRRIARLGGWRSASCSCSPASSSAGSSANRCRDYVLCTWWKRPGLSSSLPSASLLGG